MSINDSYNLKAKNNANLSYNMHDNTNSTFNGFDDTQCNEKSKFLICTIVKDSDIEIGELVDVFDDAAEQQVVKTKQSSRDELKYLVEMDSESDASKIFNMYRDFRNEEENWAVKVQFYLGDPEYFDKEEQNQKNTKNILDESSMIINNSFQQKKTNNSNISFQNTTQDNSTYSVFGNKEANINFDFQNIFNGSQNQNQEITTSAPPGLGNIGGQQLNQNQQQNDLMNSFQQLSLDQNFAPQMQDPQVEQLQQQLQMKQQRIQQQQMEIEKQAKMKQLQEQIRMTDQQIFQNDLKLSQQQQQQQQQNGNKINGGNFMDLLNPSNILPEGQQLQQQQQQNQQQQFLDLNNPSLMDQQNLMNPQYLKAMRKSKVIYARWFKKEKVNLNMLYNVFSVFGNVVKMIYMKEKLSCLVEYQTLEQTKLAKEALNDMKFYGQDLKIFYSNYNEVTVKPKAPKMDNKFNDNQEEFLVGNDQIWRYKGEITPSVNVCDTLFVGNINPLVCDPSNQQQFFSLFSRVGFVQNYKFIPNLNGTTSCLLKFPTKEIALETLSLLHSFEIAGQKINVMFSKNRM